MYEVEGISWSPRQHHRASISPLCRTTAHSITTRPSMTMTEMTWETAATTALTTTTLIRQTQTTTEREMLVPWTSTETVRHPPA